MGFARVPLPRPRMFRVEYARTLARYRPEFWPRRKKRKG